MNRLVAAALTLGLAGGALVVAGCVSMAVTAAGDACPLLATYEDEAELKAGLKGLYKQHQTELIVIGLAVYANT
jgi:hypothetical protein